MIIIWVFLGIAVAVIALLIVQTSKTVESKAELQEAEELLSSEETKALARKLREKAEKLKGDVNEG